MRTPGTNRPRRPFPGNLFLAVLSSLVLLVVVEMGFRIWLGHYAPRRVRVIYSSRMAKSQFWQYTSHHYLNHVNQSDYVSDDGRNRHDALGYRGDTQIAMPKPAGEFRIVAIGGSTTYSAGVGDWHDSYPAQLERVLREDYHRGEVRVVNAGVGGYDSWESLLNLEFRVLDLEPDLIIVYHGYNDISSQIVPPDRYRGDNSGRRKRWDDALASSWKYRVPSVLWQFAGVRLGWIDVLCLERLSENCSVAEAGISERVNPVLGMTPAEALRVNSPVYYERNLRNLIAIARTNDVEVLLLTFALNPRASAYAKPNCFPVAIHEHNEIVRGLAEESDTALLDFESAMPLDPLLWRKDGIHFTADGNRVRAGIIAKQIVRSEVLARR